MNWHDRLYVGTADGVAVVPLLLMVYFLVRGRRYLLVTGWRCWLALTGLALGLVAALPAPLFYSSLELPETLKETWVPRIAGGLPAGLAAGLVAIPLLAFARGRVRWMGIVSMLVCVALLYFTLLGVSD